MPRWGSSCTERVCRVPNETSLRIVASIRLGSISRKIARSSGAGEGLRRSAASASPEPETPAAMVAADTVRKVRRVDLAMPTTLVLRRRHVHGCRYFPEEYAPGRPRRTTPSRPRPGRRGQDEADGTGAG